MDTEEIRRLKELSGITHESYYAEDEDNLIVSNVVVQTLIFDTMK